jgi:hypothetical protein
VGKVKEPGVAESEKAATHLATVMSFSSTLRKLLKVQTSPTTVEKITLLIKFVGGKQDEGVACHKIEREVPHLKNTVETGLYAGIRWGKKR